MESGQGEHAQAFADLIPRKVLTREVARRGSVDVTVKVVPYGTLARASVQRGRAALGSAIAHAMTGDMEKGRMRMDEAVSLRSGCGRTLFNRAVLNMMASDWELAERDLRGK